MATLHITLQRRSWQKLWTQLDQCLRPRAAQGIVLAISGGPDSRALLESVANWPNRLEGRFLVASLDHAMRRESLQESQFVLMRARRLGFDVHLGRLEHTGHFGEKELRDARYQYLLQLCHSRGFSSICTAHHLDDNAEGFLMSLMGLGGGSHGSAMSEVDSFHGKTLIRPFLALSKNDLRLALNLANISDYAIDSLDEAQKGSRAFVRHCVLPTMGKNSPNLSRRLESFARRQAVQEDMWGKTAADLIEWQNNAAVLSLKEDLDARIIEKSIKLILKQLCPAHDLRSAARAVTEVALRASKRQTFEAQNLVGLDPAIKWFKVRSLNTTVYSLPGARLFLGPEKIVVERI